MTLADLLSELDHLSQTEKLKVIQHLAHTLETETTFNGQLALTSLAKEYEIWSPQDQGNAVSTLHALLKVHEQKNNAE